MRWNQIKVSSNWTSALLVFLIMKSYTSSTKMKNSVLEHNFQVENSISSIADDHWTQKKKFIVEMQIRINNINWLWTNIVHLICRREIGFDSLRVVNCIIRNRKHHLKKKNHWFLWNSNTLVSTSVCFSVI